MKLIVIAIALLGFVTCSKTENSKKSDIVGKWLLMESLISPGDAGEWIKADPNNPVTISFGKDGSIKNTPKLEYAALFYQLTSDSTMLMFRTSDTLPYRYNISNDELMLYPPCIEPCAMKYKAVDTYR